ncbi:YhcN/YlaJ family sporulation lipoprotein [Halobacillus sp. H74]|uniref:YhcN/YlaJ family sporulation lipoprotein n=1 Tax=Halobacillus sp. H74 TaxID=3457436 RepID=UPI003FCD8178
MKRFLTVMLAVSVLASGCQEEKETKDKNESSQTVQLSTNKQTADQTPSKQAESVLQKKNHLKDIQAVNDDKKILIAAQPPHNERFKIAKIENKITKQAEKQFPGHEVTLSLDLKIRLEVKELKQQIKNKEVSRKEVTKEIDRLINLSKRNQ